jgi:hypothetical protein
MVRAEERLEWEFLEEVGEEDRRHMQRRIAVLMQVNAFKYRERTMIRTGFTSWANGNMMTMRETGAQSVVKCLIEHKD